MTFINSQVDRKLNRFAPVFRDYPFLAEERHECAVDNADVHFIFEQVGKVPDSIKRVVLNNAFKIKVRQERNLYILRTTKLIIGLLPEKLRDSLTVDDDEIRAIAQDCADRCRRLALHHQAKSFSALNRKAQLLSLTEQGSRYGYDAMYPLTSLDTFYKSLLANVCTRYENRPMYPLTGTSSKARSRNVTALPECRPKTTELFGHDTELITEHTEPFSGICKPNEGEIHRTLTEYVTSYQIMPIDVSAGSVTIMGAIKRMCDKHWWYRRLRKLFNQAYEHAAIELNLVNRHKQIYASDLTVLKRKQQKLRNEQLLSSMFVLNDIGQRFSLKELSDLNVSNPAVRKAELMVRMRGFEELSKSHGHTGIFITITCPSKYHAAYAKSGQRNDKYEGLTPYQGNQYLCSVWARIRAEWSRNDIKPYGFRVSEPQHDGTPHWHVLLFAPTDQIDNLKGVVRHYALQEDGDEQGAEKNRCDFKIIDPKKGSATGYIAKYVSKNIDGEGLDAGVYGEDPISAAQRVDAWASCWCIRQFQQIGGASVSVWRELRRLKQAFTEDSPLEAARKAADESKWNDYTNAMGGVFVKRKEHLLKLAYDASFDSETGDCRLGRYDNDIIQTVKGLYYQGQMIVTRFFRWRLEKTGTAFFNLEFCK